MKTKLFLFFDIFLYLIIIFCAIFFFLRFHENQQSVQYLKVVTSKSEYLYPLSEYKTYCFKGPIGLSTVKVNQEGAFFVQSDCPTGSCQVGNALNRFGQWRACLPNEVVITIVGVDSKAKGGVDAVLY